jgi:hypothetical protein
MKQTIHIFRKDLRFLRLEIAGFLLLVLVFAMTGETDYVSEAVEIAALYLVVRMIHAEAIPGDRQYWLTRPYRPMSLLGAKLLFIAAIVCLPLGMAQAAMAARMGFPLAGEIPGLLWSQVLFFFAAALPVAALAAVTEGLVPFVSAVLVLTITAVFGATTFHHTPPPVEWIGDSIFGAATICISATVLLWQYRDRRTLFSRLCGTIAYSAALAFYLFAPASLALNAQTWFSKNPGLASAVRVSVKPDPNRATAWSDTKTARVPVPLTVGGISEGMEVRSDSLSISFAWPDRKWSPALNSGTTPHEPVNGEAALDALVHMSAGLYRAERTSPLTVRGFVYLTLFGEPERRMIPLKLGPMNAQDGLQCFSGGFLGGDYMLCRSLFRWPGRLVHAKDTVADFGDSTISYSPFPAELNLNPLQIRWAESVHADEATIVTKRPLAHFRCDFEQGGLRLTDFEPPPPPGLGPAPGVHIK